MLSIVSVGLCVCQLVLSQSCQLRSVQLTQMLKMRVMQDLTANNTQYQQTASCQWDNCVYKLLYNDSGFRVETMPAIQFLSPLEAQQLHTALYGNIQLFAAKSLPFFRREHLELCLLSFDFLATYDGIGSPIGKWMLWIAGDIFALEKGSFSLSISRL